MQDREGTAYHEAGHAALMFHFKQIIEIVTIISAEDSLGYCKGERLDDFPLLDQIDDPNEVERAVRIYEEEILICLAGPEAEGLFTGHYYSIGAGGDYEKASELAKRLGLDNCDDYLVQLADWLQSDPINRHIKVIAKSLLDKNTLTGEEVKTLLEG
jgi:peptidase M41-like protein